MLQRQSGGKGGTLLNAVGAQLSAQHQYPKDRLWAERGGLSTSLQRPSASAPALANFETQKPQQTQVFGCSEAPFSMPATKPTTSRPRSAAAGAESPRADLPRPVLKVSPGATQVHTAPWRPNYSNHAVAACRAAVSSGTMLRSAGVRNTSGSSGYTEGAQLSRNVSAAAKSGTAVGGGGPSKLNEAAQEWLAKLEAGLEGKKAKTIPPRRSATSLFAHPK